MSKRRKKTEVGRYVWPKDQHRDADRALYNLMQTLYELRLISEPAFHYGTTTETKLLDLMEDV